MAEVDLISIQITDYTGDVKAIPVYVPHGETLASLQTIADAAMTTLYPCIDGVITGVTVTVNLVVLVAATDTPVAGNTVHEGALLRYGAEDTSYNYSVFVPSWKNAGFAGNEAVETGVYGAMEVGWEYADKNGNQLDAYLGGERRFRK